MADPIPTLPHSHARCGKCWAGSNTAHCGTCCETFSSPSAFDSHRIRRGLAEGTCAEPVAIGLVLADRSGYKVWGRPADEASTARMAALRAQREAVPATL